MTALLVIAALALGDYAPQAMAAPMLPAEQEARVQALGTQLRCAVCQGLSIAASPSTTARAQLDMVRELVQQGKTDQQIKEYFVERYGEWVLLSPTAEGVNWLVWLAPLALLVAGAVAIARTLRPGRAPAAAAPPALADDEFMRRVREEIDG